MPPLFTMVVDHSHLQLLLLRLPPPPPHYLRPPSFFAFSCRIPFNKAAFSLRFRQRISLSLSAAPSSRDVIISNSVRSPTHPPFSPTRRSSSVFGLSTLPPPPPPPPPQCPLASSFFSFCCCSARKVNLKTSTLFLYVACH